MQKYHDEPKQYKGYLKSALMATGDPQNFLLHLWRDLLSAGRGHLQA